MTRWGGAWFVWRVCGMWKRGRGFIPRAGWPSVHGGARGRPVGLSELLNSVGKNYTVKDAAEEVRLGPVLQELSCVRYAYLRGRVVPHWRFLWTAHNYHSPHC